jgi:N-acetylneuraminic acid mutarotase
MRMRVRTRVRCLLFLSGLGMASSYAPSRVKISPVTTKGVAPKVSGHGTAVVGNKILLFGGLDENRKATNELWQFSPNEEKGGGWTQLRPRNVGPGPRMYAQTALLSDKLYVIGGWDPEEKGSGGSFKDEVWALDLGPELTWERLKPALPSGPVSRHTSVAIPSSGIVVSHTFKDAEHGGVMVMGTDGVTKIQITTGTENAPTGYSMCAAAALGSKMIIFGGSTKGQAMTGDAFCLDTTKWHWTKLIPRGDVPSPRTSACMVALDHTCCLVFGGAGLGSDGYDGGKGLVAFNQVHLLRIDGNHTDWELLELSDSPRARVAATLTKVPGTDNTILLQGGWDPATAETFDTPYRFELS